MGTDAIEVTGVGKRYAMGEREQYRALRDVPGQLARRVGRDRSSSRAERRQAWALRDVTFSVPRGEVLGIVGRNGAGKSTMLKILANITRPTTGEAVMWGRVGSLLEVGSGFHPELTGHENIYLNGSILGMRKAEIDRRYDAIADFSGVRDHLDTPVKRYSTGMYMRLAFAVAAHLEPEILLVDEVLAVGDAEFQRKCLGRIRELAGGHGRTVVFVSHNTDAVRQLCDRCVWLDDGEVRAVGPAGEVVDAYLSEAMDPSAAGEWIDLTDAPRSGTGEARFDAVRYRGLGGTDPRVRAGRPVEIAMRIVAERPLAAGSVAVYLSTPGGTKLVSAGTGAADPTVDLAPGLNELAVRIDDLPLNAGTFRAGLWLARPLGADRGWGLYDHVESAVELRVHADGDGPPAEGLVRTTSALSVTTGTAP